MMKIPYWIYWILKSEMEKPPMYGLFHIIGLLIVVATLIVLTILSRKDRTDKFYKRILFVCWVSLVFFEIVKEFSSGISYVDKLHFEYNFLTFPFQLCSLPFYTLPFVIFVKNEKTREYFVLPSITYILLGGTLFLFFPGSLQTNIYLNFHTLAHHGLQVISSFTCLLWHKDKFNLNKFAKMLPLLILTMSLAIALNIHLYKTTGKNVQLWNLSPYVVMDMEVLETIRQSVGYVGYVALYIVILTMLSFILYLIVILIIKLTKQREKD